MCQACRTKRPGQANRAIPRLLRAALASFAGKANAGFSFLEPEVTGNATQSSDRHAMLYEPAGSWRTKRWLPGRRPR